MIWCLSDIALSCHPCLLVCFRGHLFICSEVKWKSRTHIEKAMQNKPKSNLSPSGYFTVTTIDAFKLTGKSSRLIDFNSPSLLRATCSSDFKLNPAYNLKY